jgi:hypothetical protein
MAVTVKDVDKGWTRIAKDVKELKGYSVKVGVMGNDSVEGISVIDYAVFNEFGTSRIPARPFMQTTYNKHAEEAGKYIDYMAGKLIDGAVAPMQVLKDLGLWYESKMKAVIRDAKNWAVPNAASTVKMKGSSSPLIDTGRMLGSIKYEIEKGRQLLFAQSMK